jgi:hypothetical protein
VPFVFFYNYVNLSRCFLKVCESQLYEQLFVSVSQLPVTIKLQ